MGLTEGDIARVVAWMELRKQLTPAIDAAMCGWQDGDAYNVAVYRDGHTIKINIERMRDGRNVREDEPHSGQA